MTDTAGRNVMPPGRELDAEAFNAEVAEKVVGWQWYRWTSFGVDYGQTVRALFDPNSAPSWATPWTPDMGDLRIVRRGPLPDFLHDWAAMRLVVERMVALGHIVSVDVEKSGARCCVRGDYVGGDTLPHAVCLAALAAFKAVEADRA